MSLNPLLLRTARESLGLTQEQFASRAGFAQAEVSRWEKGIREPDDAQVQLLADAAEIPAALLSSDFRIGQPVHRSQKREKRKVSRIVNARLELARLALESLLDTVELDDPPLAFADPEEILGRDPEAAAAILRRAWGIGSGPLPPMTELVESAGSVLAPVDFASKDIIAAYSRIRGGQRWFWVNTQAPDPARLRFSVAHELGHALLHWERITDPVVVDAEKEAHQFAAAFLMPADEIKRHLNRVSPTLPNLIRVATLWQVSVQALVMRAHQVKVLTTTEHAGIWRMLNARGLGKAAMVDVAPEPGGVLAAVLQIHREDGLSDEAIADMTTLPLHRLQDLTPTLFPRARSASGHLRVVRASRQHGGE